MLQISTNLHDKTLTQAADRAREIAKLKDGNSQPFWNSEDSGFHRGWKLFQLDLNYRHSPFVNDDRYAHSAEEKSDAYGVRGHDIRAGDRAPDAPGLVTLAGPKSEAQGKTMRIFDLFDPTMHTVLVFSSATSEDETRGLTQPVLSALERLAPGLVRTALIVRGDAKDAHVPYAEVDYVLKDAEGYAFKDYGLEEGKSAVVVVRPDTYIGAFALGANGVKRYLDTTFGPASA